MSKAEELIAIGAPDAEVCTSLKVDFWASKIKKSIGKSLAAALETGNLLTQAKAALSHGEWLPLLKKLGLNPRTAQLWMNVARNPRFANANLDSLLPASPTVLAEISRLPKDLYQQALADGTINPAVSRTAIAEIVRRAKRKADEERVGNLVPVSGKFSTLIIDPPWQTSGGRGCPYALMNQQQLLDLPVPQWLQDDAHVYLWTTNEEFENALCLFTHWEILRKQILCWNKTYANGAPKIGMGHNFRNTVEFILFGVRGHLRTREAARSIGTGFNAPVTGEHSTKPDKFYEIVKAASYPPFGEVGQRTPRDGFVNLFIESALATKAAA
jgi:N6-adenosine-specific RNA methylase IME4